MTAIPKRVFKVHCKFFRGAPNNPIGIKSNMVLFIKEGIASEGSVDQINETTAIRNIKTIDHTQERCLKTIFIFFKWTKSVNTGNTTTPILNMARLHIIPINKIQMSVV